MIKRLHHVGIAVDNLDDSVAVYERLLGGNPLYVRECPHFQIFYIVRR